MPRNAKGHNPIEIVDVGDGLGIIIVGPSPMWERIEGLRMVEVAPLRFLLTIPLGTSIDSFAMAINDEFENAETVEDWERSILTQLRNLISHLRRQGGLSKAEIIFVDTKSIHEEASGAQQMHAGASSSSAPLRSKAAVRSSAKR